MNNKLLFLVVLCGLLSFCSVYAADIGCEPYNATVLRCWNQGSIEPVTFYRMTSDGLQLCNNDTGRFDWVTYRHGFLYYNNAGVPQILNFFDYDLDFYKEVGSEHYILTWNKSISVGGKQAIIMYSAGQLLYDDYVNFTIKLITISGFTAWNKSVSLWRQMKNIDVGNDGDIDVINFRNETGDYLGLYLNFTTLTKFNISGKYVQIGDMDGLATDNVVWRWKDNRYRELWIKPRLPGNPGNNHVYWLRSTAQPLVDGKAYELSEGWIDAPVCSVSCPKNVNYHDVDAVCSATGNNYYCAGTTRNISLFAEIWHTSLFGSGVCSYGEGCRVIFYDNLTGVFTEIPYRTSTTDREVVCDSYSVSTCEQNSIIARNIFLSSFSDTRKFNVTCRKEGNLTFSWCEFPYYTDYCQHYMELGCPADSGSPNVYLWNPNASNNSFSSTQTIIFNCSATDDYPLRNVTLWHNLTGAWLPNVSQSLSLTNNGFHRFGTTYTGINPGTYAYNCKYCDNNDNCAFNLTNNTFIVNSLIPPVLNEAEISKLPYKCGINTSIFLVSNCSDANNEDCYRNNTADVVCWDANNSLSYPDYSHNWIIASECVGDWDTGKRCNITINASAEFDYCGNITCRFEAYDLLYHVYRNDSESLPMKDVEVNLIKTGNPLELVIFLIIIGVVFMWFGYKYDVFYYCLSSTCFFLVASMFLRGVYLSISKTLEVINCETCSGFVRITEDSWVVIPHNYLYATFFLLLGLFLMLYYGYVSLKKK